MVHFTVDLQKIRAKRRELEYSQGYMALALGFSSINGYHAKERGIRNWEASELMETCSLLELDINDVLIRKQKKESVNGGT